MQVMNMLRLIVMLAVWLGFSYSSCWVSSSDILFTDTASCFKYAHLLSIAPSMKKKPCTSHPPLHRCMNLHHCSPQKFIRTFPAAARVPTVHPGQQPPSVKGILHLTCQVFTCQFRFLCYQIFRPQFQMRYSFLSSGHGVQWLQDPVVVI